jgi:crotonobetainyl-CoA:carnitine CoA-transferase CaiB-like acyl-CoA transferase
MLKLIDTADVFLNNMSIQAPERMGLGPEVLLARNPRLIYAHASGWGRKGPDADEFSFDYTGIARSGLMMSCGEKGAPPTQILPGIGDEMGALACAWAVTAALYAREKTGKGQVVDTSLMGSVIAMLGFIMAAPAIMGQEFPEIRAQAGMPCITTIVVRMTNGSPWPTCNPTAIAQSVWRPWIWKGWPMTTGSTP